MGDTYSSSCSSRAVDLSSSSSSSPNRNHKQKVVVYNQVLRRLVALNVADSLAPGFEDELWAHFNRLPTRYAMEVNVERAQDVIMHKRLLEMAHDPATRPAVEVQLVQVDFASGSGSQRIVEAKCIHPPPVFDLSPDLRLALEAHQLSIQNQNHAVNSSRSNPRPMHEITISTNDKPKLFNQLTCLLSEIGLNIQEAHAFSTIDGYSLDVFLVDGWDLEDAEQLKLALAKKISRIEQNYPGLDYSISPAREKEAEMKLLPNIPNIPNDVSYSLDFDLRLLKIEKLIASGLIGDLYKGTLYNQDVAIKVLRNEYLNDAIHREFLQEVDIMRKVQHGNVLGFIGARIRPPSMCIVTEFMPGGSLFDYTKQHGFLPRQSLIRVAIDVSKGMNYLHQNNIIHRDLKTANLLMDGKGVVKVSDFGVARVQAQSGVMTAETGTYRWMAPEVIEHKPYDHKADVFGFGIVLWELLTGKIPYENLTPLQAAVGVVQKGLRPTIPAHADPVLVELMENCWQHEPSLRPQFSEILEMLLRMSKRVMDKRMDRQKEKSSRIAPTFMHPTA